MTIKQQPDTWNTFLKMFFFSLSGLIFVASLLTHQLQSPTEEGFPQPAVSDLVGNWVPDEATKAFLLEKGLKGRVGEVRPQLILRSFEYQLKELPDLVWSDEGKLEIISRSGTWGLFQTDGAWGINFYPEMQVTGYIIGEKPPYRISLPFHTYGQRRLTFVREE